MQFSEIIKYLRNGSFLVLLLVIILGFIYNSFFIINKGFRLIKKGKYKDAIEEFNKELKTKTGNWQLFYGLAYCYFMLGFNRNSIEFYKKTLELQTKKSLIYTEVAILYIELEKDFENAKQYLEKAISINKQKLFLFRSSQYVFSEIYGRIYLLQNDWDRAQEYYKIAIPKYEKLLNKISSKKIERFSPLYFRLGSYYLKLNKSEKAKKYFDLVIKLSNESFFADKSQEELNKIG
jgi:tetratricopeptide (TPR) repeat protein